MTALLPFDAGLGAVSLTQAEHVSVGASQYPAQLYYSADFDMTFGDRVLAIEEGTVVFAYDGVVDGASMAPVGATYAQYPNIGPGSMGNLVTIFHESLSLYVTYAHLRYDSIDFEVGDRVRQGQIIGQVGRTGVADPLSFDHLHITYGQDTVAFGGSTLADYGFLATIADGSQAGNPAGFGLFVDEAGGDRLQEIDYTSANRSNGGVITTGGTEPDFLSGGQYEDNLGGGGGNDTLAGAASADTLDGGDGNDRVFGDAGIDSLIGGMGNDVYAATQDDIIVERAAEGFDAVWVVGGASYVIPAHVEMMLLAPGQPLIATGTALANIMVGNGNANILQGFGGNDQIDGGQGADTLLGGTGRDSLHGGTGADQFRFDALSHSAVLAPDLIVDFTHTALELDRINLAVIDANTLLAGDQGFTFIGAGAFTGAAGQLRATPTAGLGYAVSGDTNGDRVADIVINVLAATAPTAQWFIA